MSPAPPSLHPLTFEPIYKEKVWGGRMLARHFGRDLPDGRETRIGESWELADLGRTSPTGGGGGAERSVVARGPSAGWTFRELIEHHGKDLLGHLPLNAFEEFPLLLKFLDARQNLSVQVHPSPAYAADHEQAHLKSEAWYILHADPGAVIYKGVKEGVTPARFREAVGRGELEPLLGRVEARGGDCHYLPSGTCHALGAGVLVAEVQTPSDTTFRVYDWGRTGRALHLEQAMQSMDFSPPRTQAHEGGPEIAAGQARRKRLVQCEYFRIERIQAEQEHRQELFLEEPAVWMILSGTGVMRGPGDFAMEIQPGLTIYLPPKMGEAGMEAREQLTWLEVTFPQAGSGGIA